MIDLADLARHLESARHHLDCIDSSDEAIADDEGTDTVRVASAKLELDEALALIADP